MPQDLGVKGMFEDAENCVWSDMRLLPGRGPAGALVHMLIKRAKKISFKPTGKL